MSESKAWSIPASKISKNTINPIRQIVDKVFLELCLILSVDAQIVVPKAEGNKQLIPLSIGDPTGESFCVCALSNFTKAALCICAVSLRILCLLRLTDVYSI